LPKPPRTTAAVVANLTIYGGNHQKRGFSQPEPGNLRVTPPKTPPEPGNLPSQSKMGGGKTQKSKVPSRPHAKNMIILYAPPYISRPSPTASVTYICQPPLPNLITFSKKHDHLLKSPILPPKSPSHPSKCRLFARQSKLKNQKSKIPTTPRTRTTSSHRTSSAGPASQRSRSHQIA
jgi:hypothetical protein